MWCFVRCCGAVVAAAAGCLLFGAAPPIFAAAAITPTAIAVLTAAASVGCLAALAALLQGLPQAMPLLQQLLLLQILGRTIVCSAVLPSPGLELMTT